MPKELAGKANNRQPLLLSEIIVVQASVTNAAIFCFRNGRQNSRFGFCVLEPHHCHSFAAAQQRIRLSS